MGQPIKNRTCKQLLRYIFCSYSDGSSSSSSDSSSDSSESGSRSSEESESDEKSSSESSSSSGEETDSSSETEEETVRPSRTLKVSDRFVICIVCVDNQKVNKLGKSSFGKKSFQK